MWVNLANLESDSITPGTGGDKELRVYKNFAYSLKLAIPMMAIYVKNINVN